MSTLSSFFGNVSGGSGSVLTIFSNTGSLTVPNTVRKMSYAVIGAGGGGGGCNDTNGCSACCYSAGGGGGGFSYLDGCVTCSSSFSVCAIVGAYGYGGNGVCGQGGSSCITGICLGVICATGGGGQLMSGTPGCGYGGSINSIGGCSRNSGAQPTSYAGGGAGGLYGAGGCSCISCGGGGGFGSGGGGGANGGMGGPGAQSGGQCCFCGGPPGGNGLVGSGGTSAQCIGCGLSAGVPAQAGYIPQYVIDGRLSQGKTFLAQAGGGGAGACYGSYSAAAGGGGGYSGNAGFGGGAGYAGYPGVGGGAYSTIASSTSCGGSGFAVVEYWTN